MHVIAFTALNFGGAHTKTRKAYLPLAAQYNTVK